MIDKKDKQLMKEIKKDITAFELLKTKAQWEHMSLYGVLKEWGDPRKWMRRGRDDTQNRHNSV